MKNWIAITAIAVSFALFAQQGKGNKNKDQGNKGKSSLSINLDQNKNKNKGNSSKQKGKPDKQQAKPSKQKGKSGKSNVKVNPKKPKTVNKGNGNKGVFHPGNKGSKGLGKHPNLHYKKGHVNHVYMYNYGPISYPTKNYGQWRSRQARNKHRHYHPVLEIDARNAIIMISDRNAFLHVEIGNKIDRYERLVIERHDAGLISDVEFTAHRAKIKHYRQTNVQFNFYV